MKLIFNKKSKSSLTGLLDADFNLKKFHINYKNTTKPELKEIQNISANQVLGRDAWGKIDKINAWMVSAETAVFMKLGGLGVVASELPEAFNLNFKNEKITVITPLYRGSTLKKSTNLEGDIYTGSQKKSAQITLIKSINVPFYNDDNELINYKVDVYETMIKNTRYLLLDNDFFFEITPHKKNPSANDGCYVLNKNNVGEVMRFAFLSKAIYCLLESLASIDDDKITLPNVILANDWHVGALSGLTKIFSYCKYFDNCLTTDIMDKLKNIRIIHIAHHLGYQGWEYKNSYKLLNSLYEKYTVLVLENLKAVANSNPRANSALMIHDCYNQSACNINLADRVVTVSTNYANEVAHNISFGCDFHDILNKRKQNKTFYGIVNGIYKASISPNPKKIKEINNYFGEYDFKVYNSISLENKTHNKQEFIKLISQIANDTEYKQKVIPKIELHNFPDLNSMVKDIHNVPILCATSRLVEQKGYDTIANSILEVAKKLKTFKREYPIFILGGAGDIKYFNLLIKIKKEVARYNKDIAQRMLVFRGYNDDFAYSIQLAADFYLMPCRFEPCGLTQLEAMAKATLPITTSTGGLVDTIKNGVDGFRTQVFFKDDNKVYGSDIVATKIQNNTRAYIESVVSALIVFYKNPSQMRQMQYNAISNDFSWDMRKTGSVYKYYQLMQTGNIW